MARKRIYDNYEVPKGVVNIVKTVCADYDRRSKGNADEAVLETYLQLNGVIDTALEEIEAGIRRVILDDVRLGRGYDFSPASPFLAKNSYYNRKRQFVYNVARGLKLI
jgi:hypothetical protein